MHCEWRGNAIKVQPLIKFSHSRRDVAGSHHVGFVLDAQLGNFRVENIGQQTVGGKKVESVNMEGKQNSQFHSQKHFEF